MIHFCVWGQDPWRQNQTCPLDTCHDQVSKVVLNKISKEIEETNVKHVHDDIMDKRIYVLEKRRLGSDFVIIVIWNSNCVL